MIADSLLGESCGHEDRDHFGKVSPNTDWKVAIDHGVKLGLGNKEYELIEV